MRIINSFINFIISIISMFSTKCGWEHSPCVPCAGRHSPKCRKAQRDEARRKMLKALDDSNAKLANSFRELREKITTPFNVQLWMEAGWSMVVDMVTGEIIEETNQHLELVKKWIHKVDEVVCEMMFFPCIICGETFPVQYRDQEGMIDSVDPTNWWCPECTKKERYIEDKISEQQQESFQKEMDERSRTEDPTDAEWDTFFSQQEQEESAIETYKIEMEERSMIKKLLLECSAVEIIEEYGELYWVSESGVVPISIGTMFAVNNLNGSFTDLSGKITYWFEEVETDWSKYM